MTKVSRRNGTTTRLLRGTRFFVRDERGAVAVIFALLVGTLLGVLALSIDLGRAWNTETELQNAADAAALAGATQLDGTTDARVRAIRAAVVSSVSELANNRQHFAIDDVDADSFGGADGLDIRFDTTEDIDGDGKTVNRDVKFYSALPISAANEATSDADARFIEVNVFPREVDFSFAAIVGAVDSASPHGRAVAGWETFYCDSPQMMMCNPNEQFDAGGEPIGIADFNIYEDCPNVGPRGTSCVGRGVTMKEHGGGGQLFPGNFAFLSLTVVGQDGEVIEKVTGASKLKEFLAGVVSGQSCTGNYSQTEPGNMSALGQWINMRFDQYHDDSYRYGAPNYQPSPNVVKGLVTKPGWTSADRCRYNTVAGAPDTGSSEWTWPSPRYGGPGRHMDNPADRTTVNLDPATGFPIGSNHPGEAVMGYPRDTCAYVPKDVAEANGFDIESDAASPEIDIEVADNDYDVAGGAGSCIFAPPNSIAGLFSDADQVGTGEWDIETYIEAHHPNTLGLMGMAAVVDMLDRPNDLDIGDASKDGVISRWEMYKWEMSDPNNMPNGGDPVCYDDGTQDLPIPPAVNALDRRIMIMAVVNCGLLDKGGGRKIVKRVKPHGSIALFLTEPMGAFDEDAIYGEIVDPAGLSGADEEDITLIRERLVLIE